MPLCITLPFAYERGGAQTPSRAPKRQQASICRSHDIIDIGIGASCSADLPPSYANPLGCQNEGVK